MTSATLAPVPDYWETLVRGVVTNDNAAMEEFYKLFNARIRFLLMNHLGMDMLDDHLHDVFLEAVRSIRKGLLTHPAALVSFCRTIANRHVARRIKCIVEDRARHDHSESTLYALADVRSDSEAPVLTQEINSTVRGTLDSLYPHYREILIRCFVHGQSQDVVMRAMELSETAYRLLKWRAKSDFISACRRRLMIGANSRRAEAAIPLASALRELAKTGVWMRAQ